MIDCFSHITNFSQNNLIDTSQLIHKYFSLIPNPYNMSQRVKFGTSGHRGSSMRYTFNERHVLAIAQAIVELRKKYQVNGPCYVGRDTHALSEVAFISVLEVLSANRIEIIVEKFEGYTPSPVIAHAILNHNKNFSNNNLVSDGIVITSSHNAPEDGGIKYYSYYGGSADTDVTENIEKYSNAFLLNNLRNIRRFTLNQGWNSGYIHILDLTQNYVAELTRIVDMQSIKQSGLKLYIDLMGGAGIHCWQRIAQFYKLDLIFIHDTVDPTFQFIYSNRNTIFWLDCSAKMVITDVLDNYHQFDLILSTDPDGDRHGIITPIGFIESNNYLTLAISYLFRHRPTWSKKLCVGKSIVSSVMIDKIVENLNLCLVESPIGFKWFVKNLFYSVLGFVGEESSGGIFLDFNSFPWGTDKDGIAMCLLAAEISAVTGKILQEFYHDLIKNIDLSSYNRMQIPIERYSLHESAHERFFNFFISKQMALNELAGDPIIKKIKIIANKQGTKIDGIKLVTNNGWVACRRSGTENIYKIYSESLLDHSHREKIERETCEYLSYISKIEIS